MNHFEFHQTEITFNLYDLEMVFIDHKEKRHSILACGLTTVQIPRRVQLFKMASIIDFAKSTLNWRNRAYQENFTPSKFALLDRLELLINTWANHTDPIGFANFYNHNIQYSIEALLPRPDSRLYDCSKKRIDLINLCIDDLNSPIAIQSVQTSLFGATEDYF